MHLFLVMMLLTLGNVFVTADFLKDIAYSIATISSNDYLLELSTGTIIRCMRKCKENEDCSYFGYHDVNRICTMYMRSTGDRHEIPSSEWEFYQMKDRQQLGQDPQCPNGFEKIDNECFYIEINWMGMSWHAAQYYGGYLAEPDTHQSVRKLNDAVDAKRNMSTYNWLGGSDIQNEGNWLWNSTAKQIVATNWISNEPNGGTDENCLALYQVLRNEPTWHDAPCSYTFHIICEI